jgi:hypothetical protein
MSPHNLMKLSHFNLFQDFTSGLMHMEKTADKWGKNGKGEQWQEQWWEQYDSSGKAEKSADKWCSLDPNTPLDVGHAHVWHERYTKKLLSNFQCSSCLNVSPCSLN